MNSAVAIAYRKPKSGWLAPLFILSIGLHVGLAIAIVWASHLLQYKPKEDEWTEMGVEFFKGEEVQKLVAETSSERETVPTDSLDPLPPDPPDPPPPPDPPRTADFVEPEIKPIATPVPRKQPRKPAQARDTAETGPRPRPGQHDGNVTKGNLNGDVGGTNVGTQGWRTPKPPYPAAALASRIQGSGSVRISTDGSGNVVNVIITGPVNPLLDANTRTFARSNWKGPASSARTVPVRYEIE
jgi:outer membrane biosynthesis protein TonB